MMQAQFERYLIGKGYKTTTPSGKPSTVYDYIKRVEKVCAWESMTWEALAENIGAVVSQYDTGGRKEALGRMSHNAVINALRRFSEFVAA